MPVSSSSSRSAVAHGSSPLSIPPCGICQASSVLSMRRPTHTWPRSLSSITPTPRRYLRSSLVMRRHCEEHSDEAIQFRLAGLLRYARNDERAGLKIAKANDSGSSWPLPPIC